MTPTYRIIPHDEAHAASERGERVEMRWMNCHCSLPHEWRVFSQAAIDEQPEDSIYEFRVLDPKPDPYAELKAAKAAGKVIQIKLSDGSWGDVTGKIIWALAPGDYRIKPDPKPDELVIASGKYLHREGTFYHVYAITEDGQVHGAYKGNNKWQVHAFENVAIAKTQLIAPWTDTLAPYDNWDKVPAWHKYQFQSPEGTWFSTAGKPCWNDMSKDWQGSDYRNALLTPPEFAPTNFPSAGETSLQARPQ